MNRCVATILLLLCGCAGGEKAAPKNDETSERFARQSMQLIADAVFKFQEDNERYPEKLRDLVDDGYITADLLEDPWGNEFVYRLICEEETRFNIVSFGTDGREGGGDDVPYFTD